MFTAAPCVSAIIVTSAPLATASHSGDVAVEFISSAIFCAVYGCEVSQRIGSRIIDMPSIVRSVNALSIPPANGDVPLTIPKSPSTPEVIAFPFAVVPLSAAVIVTVAVDAVAV